MRWWWPVVALVVLVGCVALVASKWWAQRGSARPLPVPSGDHEVAWLHNPTSGETWEDFVCGMKRAEMTAHGGPSGFRVDDSAAFPDHTTAVPEVVLSHDGFAGKIHVRWYKVTNYAPLAAWVQALAARTPAPLALVGGWSSDRAHELAEAMKETNWPGQKPLLLLTTATADSVYPEKDDFTPDYKPPKLIEVVRSVVPVLLHQPADGRGGDRLRPVRSGTAARPRGAPGAARGARCGGRRVGHADVALGTARGRARCAAVPRRTREYARHPGVRGCVERRPVFARPGGTVPRSAVHTRCAPRAPAGHGRVEPDSVQLRPVRAAQPARSAGRRSHPGEPAAARRAHPGGAPDRDRPGPPGARRAGPGEPRRGAADGGGDRRRHPGERPVPRRRVRVAGAGDPDPTGAVHAHGPVRLGRAQRPRPAPRLRTAPAGQADRREEQHGRRSTVQHARAGTGPRRVPRGRQPGDRRTRRPGRPVPRFGTGVLRDPVRQPAHRLRRNTSCCCTRRRASMAS